MKKFFIGFLGIIFIALLFTSFSIKLYAQNTNNFVITNFEADYYLSKDSDGAGQLKVIEKITAEFPSYDQNHGLLRAVPQKYLDKSLHLNIVSVSDGNANNLDYATYTQNNNLVLKIGNKDRYVHGTQSYTITYTLNNIIRFFDDHDEFYWNINGVEWPQQIEKLSGRIHMPSEVAASLLPERYCYTGSQGSQNSNCTFTEAKNNSETTLTLDVPKGLMPYQTATFVIGFTEGTFKPLQMTFWESYGEAIMLVGALITVTILPILTFIILFSKWRKFGRDPKGRGTIIPEYQAPKGLSVLACSAIYEQSLPNKAVSAQIIDLAIKGYIRINETEAKQLLGKSKKYSLTLLKSAGDELSDDQKSLIRGIFGAKNVGDTVTMDDLKSSFYKRIQEISSSLMDSLTINGYFVKNPQKVRGIYIISGILLLVAGVFTVMFIVGIGFIISAVLCFIFAAIMPARTQSGLAAKEHLDGLKLYISTAEKERFEYLQSVKGAERIPIKDSDTINKIKLFESLLPFAIIFGMEKSWSKQFESIYSQPPDWYNGNWSTFNTVYLASSIGAFNSASATSFSSPSSSSSSGFGGGFSGGGGGGGGGGGW
jgi:hypothetical protein